MHLKSIHKVMKGVEGEHFKTVKETSIDCQLCSLSIFRSEAEVRKHFSRNHDMTIEDYAAKFVHGGTGGDFAAEGNHLLDTSSAETTNEDIKVPKNVMW